MLIPIIVIILSALFLLSLFIYQSIFGHREKIKPGLKYFTNEEFEGVIKHPYTFKSSDCNINGFVYEKEDCNAKGVIVLVHGMGGGHINYMSEICYFALLGYKVVAYDNHGTMSSEGKNLKGFEQSVIDLRECILSIKKDIQFMGLKVILYGHSWGAYSVSSVCNYDDVKVDGIISLSSFNSPSKILTTMLKAQMGRGMAILYPFIRIIEFIKFGKVSNFTSLEGYKKCNCPILLIHGEKDNLVPYSEFANYRETLKEKKDAEFIGLSTKYHRPNITDEGVSYDNWFNKETNKIIKEKGDLKSFFESGDYNLLTKFDERVMDRVKAFIERI